MGVVCLTLDELQTAVKNVKSGRDAKDDKINQFFRYRDKNNTSRVMSSIYDDK